MPGVSAKARESEKRIADRDSQSDRKKEKNKGRERGRAWGRLAVGPACGEEERSRAETGVYVRL